MKKRELYSDKAYWLAKTQIDLYGQLDTYMKNNNLNRTQLAKKLGVSKGYISQVMNGDFDHRISKFFEMALAIGIVPQIEFVELEELIRHEEEGIKAMKWYKIPGGVNKTVNNPDILHCGENNAFHVVTLKNDFQQSGS